MNTAHLKVLRVAALAFFTTAALASCEKIGISKPGAPADQFLASISEYCGKAYEGRVVANEPELGDDPFHGQRLVMHVRECSPTEIKIPFHVGDDHSRTWIVTRTGEGVQLKHDHRHFDGSEDALSMYGGVSIDSGSATRQEFPLDKASLDLFEQAGINASTTNVWAIEIVEGKYFRYELFRPDGRLFRVDFDLTKTVDTPQTPWGYTELKK